MTTPEAQIIARLAARKDAMLGAQIAGFLGAHGIAVETLRQRRFGDCRRATIGGNAAPERGGQAHSQAAEPAFDSLVPRGQALARPIPRRDAARV